MRHARLRWLPAVLIVAALTGAVQAQEPEYAFGGGGPGLGLFMPDLSEINAFVEGAGFPAFDGDLFLVGGGGRGGVVPGPVFGGAGWGAWIESETTEAHTEYALGLGGFDSGFAVGGSVHSVLTLGALFGGGAAELVLTEYPSIILEGVSPNGIVVEPTRQTYDSFFLLVAPYIDAEILLLPWMGLAVRAGYVWSPFELNWADSGPLAAPSLAPVGAYVRFSVVFGGIGPLPSEEETAP